VVSTKQENCRRKNVDGEIVQLAQLQSPLLSVNKREFTSIIFDIRRIGGITQSSKQPSCHIIMRSSTVDRMYNRVPSNAVCLKQTGPGPDRPMYKNFSHSGPCAPRTCVIISQSALITEIKLKRNTETIPKIFQSCFRVVSGLLT